MDLDKFVKQEFIDSKNQLPLQFRRAKIKVNDLLARNPNKIQRKTNLHSVTTIHRLRDEVVKELVGDFGFGEGLPFPKRRQPVSIQQGNIQGEIDLTTEPMLGEKDVDALADLEATWSGLRMANNNARTPKKGRSSKDTLEDAVQAITSSSPVKALRSTPRNISTANGNDEEIVQTPVPLPVPASMSLREHGSLFRKGTDMGKDWLQVTTMDGSMDLALHGGFPAGRLTEICGEAGTGKTQFVTQLLLSVQLPAPYGMSKAALYLSTEHKLPTSRLNDMLEEHPVLSQCTPQPHPVTGNGLWPSTSNVHTQEINNLMLQEHVMEFQVPPLIKSHNIGLIVIDSMTANLRDEFSNPNKTFKQNMMRRARYLKKFGRLLRGYTSMGIAVVVVNQVSDRVNIYHYPNLPSQETLSTGVFEDEAKNGRKRPGTLKNLNRHERKMRLQELFFTGWGDDPDNVDQPKNPWGGLTWTKQIDCRVVLLRHPNHRQGATSEWERYIKVVSCNWAGESGRGVNGAVKFEITNGGVRSDKEIEHTNRYVLNSADPYGLDDPALTAAFEAVVMEAEREIASQGQEAQNVDTNANEPPSDVDFESSDESDSDNESLHNNEPPSDAESESESSDDSESDNQSVHNNDPFMKMIDRTLAKDSAVTTEREEGKKAEEAEEAERVAARKEKFKNVSEIPDSDDDSDDAMSVGDDQGAREDSGLFILEPDDEEVKELSRKVDAEVDAHLPSMPPAPPSSSPAARHSPPQNSPPQKTSTPIPLSKKPLSKMQEKFIDNLRHPERKELGGRPAPVLADDPNDPGYPIDDEGHLHHAGKIVMKTAEGILAERQQEREKKAEDEARFAAEEEFRSENEEPVYAAQNISTEPAAPVLRNPRVTREHLDGWGSARPASPTPITPGGTRWAAGTFKDKWTTEQEMEYRRVRDAVQKGGEWPARYKEFGAPGYEMMGPPERRKYMPADAKLPPGVHWCEWEGAPYCIALFDDGFEMVVFNANFHEVVRIANERVELERKMAQQDQGSGQEQETASPPVGDDDYVMKDADGSPIPSPAQTLREPSPRAQTPRQTSQEQPPPESTPVCQETPMRGVTPSQKESLDRASMPPPPITLRASDTPVPAPQNAPILPPGYTHSASQPQFTFCANAPAAKAPSASMPPSPVPQRTLAETQTPILPPVNPVARAVFSRPFTPTKSKLSRDRASKKKGNTAIDRTRSSQAPVSLSPTRILPTGSSPAKSQCARLTPSKSSQPVAAQDVSPGPSQVQAGLEFSEQETTLLETSRQETPAEWENGIPPCGQGAPYSYKPSVRKPNKSPLAPPRPRFSSVDNVVKVVVPRTVEEVLGFLKPEDYEKLADFLQAKGYSKADSVLEAQASKRAVSAALDDRGLVTDDESQDVGFSSDRLQTPAPAVRWDNSPHYISTAYTTTPNKDWAVPPPGQDEANDYDWDGEASTQVEAGPPRPWRTTYTVKEDAVYPENHPLQHRRPMQYDSDVEESQLPPLSAVPRAESPFMLTKKPGVVFSAADPSHHERFATDDKADVAVSSSQRQLTPVQQSQLGVPSQARENPMRDHSNPRGNNNPEDDIETQADTPAPKVLVPATPVRCIERPVESPIASINANGAVFTASQLSQHQRFDVDNKPSPAVEDDRAPVVPLTDAGRKQRQLNLARKMPGKPATEAPKRRRLIDRHENATKISPITDHGGSDDEHTTSASDTRTRLSMWSQPSKATTQSRSVRDETPIVLQEKDGVVCSASQLSQRKRFTDDDDVYDVNTLREETPTPMSVARTNLPAFHPLKMGNQSATWQPMKLPGQAKTVAYPTAPQKEQLADTRTPNRAYPPSKSDVARDRGIPYPESTDKGQIESPATTTPLPKELEDTNWEAYFADDGLDDELMEDAGAQPPQSTSHAHEQSHVMTNTLDPNYYSRQWQEVEHFDRDMRYEPATPVPGYGHKTSIEKTTMHMAPKYSSRPNPRFEALREEKRREQEELEEARRDQQEARERAMLAREAKAQNSDDKYGFTSQDLRDLGEADISIPATPPGNRATAPYPSTVPAHRSASSSQLAVAPNPAPKKRAQPETSLDLPQHADKRQLMSPMRRTKCAPQKVASCSPDKQETDSATHVDASAVHVEVPSASKQKALSLLDNAINRIYNPPRPTFPKTSPAKLPRSVPRTRSSPRKRAAPSWNDSDDEIPSPVYRRPAIYQYHEPEPELPPLKWTIDNKRISTPQPPRTKSLGSTVVQNRDFGATIQDSNSRTWFPPGIKNIEPQLKIKPWELHPDHVSIMGHPRPSASRYKGAAAGRIEEAVTVHGKPMEWVADNKGKGRTDGTWLKKRSEEMAQKGLSTDYDVLTGYEEGGFGGVEEGMEWEPDVPRPSIEE